MKVLKILPYVYVILLPYLVMMSIYFGLAVSITLALVCIILLCIAGITACVLCNISALAEKSEVKPPVMNIITKVCYIPVYIICRYFFLGMLNPFLVMVSVIPLAISICTVVFSGFCNIGNCVNLVRKDRCEIFPSVLLCLMGFVYGLDIIGGIIQFVLFFKRKNI